MRSRPCTARPDSSRAQVRAVFERRFSIERVAADYLSVYQSLRGKGRPLRPTEELPLTA